jgi:hypothetical protein
VNHESSQWTGTGGAGDGAGAGAVLACPALIGVEHAALARTTADAAI